ncbi:lipopolysaccharide assembly protein LapA domain-containing protein [Rhodococcus sp. NPDC058505]|uniref:lipopolysaccharide assembly protein LapA domain-containing protein n=1 Tax=unclassified Rhodococcus (in: high G+C Gram-positive bacteria) TaxID=192944 RepID=UPI00364634DE
MSPTDGPHRDDSDPADRADQPPGPTPAVPAPEPGPHPAASGTADTPPGHPRLGHTKAAATWTGLVIGTLVLILLLVFILQNLDSVTWNLFWWEFSLPLGVSLLLAAIAGALIMALAGGVRIMQIRRLAKRSTSG